MGAKASDIAASTLIALLLAAVAALLYNLNWIWILALTLAFDPVFLFLLRNQSRNYRKWRKHPSTFPNPMGGGILTEYQLRPWQNELKDMGGGTETKREEREIKKLDRISKKRARRVRHLQNSRS